MNYHPLFRVRSWNNGMSCMSLYVLMCPHYRYGTVLFLLWFFILPQDLESCAQVELPSPIPPPLYGSAWNYGLVERHGPLFHNDYGQYSNKHIKCKALPCLSLNMLALSFCGSIFNIVGILLTRLIQALHYLPITYQLHTNNIAQDSCLGAFFIVCYNPFCPNPQDYFTDSWATVSRRPSHQRYFARIRNSIKQYCCRDMRKILLWSAKYE